MYLISKLHAEYMLQSTSNLHQSCHSRNSVPVLLGLFLGLKIYASTTQETAVPALNQPGIEPGSGANHLMMASACNPTTESLSDIPYSSGGSDSPIDVGGL